MKKYLLIAALLALTLLRFSFQAGAVERYYINDGGEVLSLPLAECCAIGAGGVAPIGSGRLTILTADGLQTVGEAAASGGEAAPGGTGSPHARMSAVRVATDTVRVALRSFMGEERDSTVSEALLENDDGGGFRFGYLSDGRHFAPFDESSYTAVSRIIVRPGEGSGVAVYAADTEELLWTAPQTAPNAYLALRPISQGEGVTVFDGRRYYGDFCFAVLQEEKLTVMNAVPLEHYVAGVCAGEMGGAFPAEALKAQAVAARTYVMFYIHMETYHYNYGFDLTGDEYCQVYMGITDAPAILAAVRDTENVYVTWHGRVIESVFFAADGGETVSSEEQFHNALDYLRGVKDPYEASAWTGGPRGHRVGMSQWGAYAMALNYNMTYEDILCFYYTGVELSYGYL